MKKLFPLLLLLASMAPVLACSTFLINRNGQLVFGRNYDWVSGNGILMVNSAGLMKTSFVPGSKSVSWMARYGSVSFNQFGKEMPHGGMNEKGLVVELMWLQGTSYPATDQRAAVNELQWVQYQLDNCSSIEEVIATDKLIRIDRNNAAPLHFLIADASGKAATIEFLNGKMVVHKGKDLRYPVLTNSTYESSLQQLDPATRSKEPSNSFDRFTQACSLLQQYQTGNSNAAPVDYAFTMLNKVSQSQYTKWSIVYDITNKKIEFITLGNEKRRNISFADLDFQCNGSGKFVDINAALQGDLAGRLTPLSAEQNLKVIRQSATESRTHLQIADEAITALGEYFSTVKCK